MGKGSRPLTYEEKVELEKIYRVGEFSSIQIGRSYGRPPGMISHYIKQVGGYIRDSRNFTDEQEAEIAKRYLSGESAKGIARALGLPGKDTILGSLRRQNIVQRSPADRNRLYSLDENAFDVITPDAAYWWGFLYADGSVSKRSVILSLKWDDFDHVEKFKEFMKSEAPIKKYGHKLGRDIHYACYIGITSQHLASRLTELGIVPHRTRFDCVKDNLPQDMIRHWIRGFFDGDGTINSSRGQFDAGFMGSMEVMEWVRECIPFVDKNKRIHKHSISNVFYLSFSGNNVSREITSYLYDGQTLYMDRKHKLSTLIPDRYVHQRDDAGRYKN
jgi:hypothetical protein